MRKGKEVCLSVCLIDGLVLARSVFHHSLQYRSVILFGAASEIVDLEEKREALRTITNHVTPGRWEEARIPTNDEILATAVFALPIREGSAKIRQGPPKDLEEDMNYPVWAGWIPLKTILGLPEPDPALTSSFVPPSLIHDSGYVRHEIRQ